MKLEKPFKCQDCDYRATKQCVLDRHTSRVHAELVKCPECDKSVSQPRLEAHLATHVAKSVTCNECSFEAASSHSLEQVNTDIKIHRFYLKMGVVLKILILGWHVFITNQTFMKHFFRIFA